MKKSLLFAIIPGGLALVVGTFILALFLIKVLWLWTVPDILPGAVEQGLIVRSLSWFTAFKLSIFVTVLVGMVHGVSARK